MNPLTYIYTKLKWLYCHIFQQEEEIPFEIQTINLSEPSSSSDNGKYCYYDP